MIKSGPRGLEVTISLSPQAMVAVGELLDLGLFGPTTEQVIEGLVYERIRALAQDRFIELVCDDRELPAALETALARAKMHEENSK